MNPQAGKHSLIAKIISVEVIQATAIILVLGFLFFNSKISSFVVTREEGDTIKGRISSIEAGMKDINESIKENSKSQDDKLNSMGDRIINRMDKMNDDLKERIREVQPYKRPSRD